MIAARLERSVKELWPELWPVVGPQVLLARRIAVDLEDAEGGREKLAREMRLALSDVMRVLDRERRSVRCCRWRTGGMLGVVEASGEPAAGGARFATPLTPGRPSRIGRLERLAKEFGLFPLMPWQRYALTLFSEYDPATFVPFYRNIVFVCPRQCGKTSCVCFLMAMDRMLLWERTVEGGRRVPAGQKVIWSAQHITACLDSWETDMLSTKLRPSVFWGLGRFHERMQSMARPGFSCCPGEGERSYLMVVAANRRAGRGQSNVGLCVLDEAQEAHDADRENALQPTQVTVPDAQYIVTGTAGTPLSTFFRAKVEAGRALVLSPDGGVNSGTAYVEHSAEEDADAGDRRVWRSAIPALGYTITEEVVAATYEAKKAEGNLNSFRTEYLSQWVDHASEPPVPLGLVEAAMAGDPRPVFPKRAAAEQGRLFVAVDSPQEGGRCVIAVSDGRAVDLVADVDDLGRVVDTCVRYASRWAATVVGLDGGILRDHLRIIERAGGVRGAVL